VIENVSEHYLEKLRLYVNGEQKNIKLAQRTSLAQLNLPEGIYTLHVRGARGLDPIQFAYLPNLQLQLDKNEYRTNESPTLIYQRRNTLSSLSQHTESHDKIQVIHAFYTRSTVCLEHHKR